MFVPTGNSLSLACPQQLLGAVHTIVEEVASLFWGTSISGEICEPGIFVYSADSLSAQPTQLIMPSVTLSPDDAELRAEFGDYVYSNDIPHCSVATTSGKVEILVRTS